jgi:hypothetical protein
MIPQGTPAVDLPKFVAPLFTTPSVKHGDAITTITLEGNGNVPFTIGQPFKKGQLAPNDALVGRIAGREDFPLQLDVKSTHIDGSIRHANISGKVTNLLGSVVIYMLRSADPVVQSMPKPSVLEDYSIVIVENGIKYVACPSATKSKHWLAGPIAAEDLFDERFYTINNEPHKYLTAKFAVRDYDGNTKVDFIVEHTYAYLTNGTYTPAPTTATPNPVTVPAFHDIIYDVRVFVGEKDILD